MIVQVTNRGHNTVEAAGRFIPPRCASVVAVDDDRVGDLEAHPRLEVSPVDLDGLKVADLRRLADDVGHDTSGTKADLVARLADPPEQADGDGDDEGDGGG